MTKRLITLLLLLSFCSQPLAWAEDSGAVAPAAVGWGNLIVPGLGATLRGQPARGLLEATTEIGTYYGGTFYAKEGAFTIDGSVLVPNGQNISKPLVGQVLQEFGLKLHMWDTFYNYQQAALHPGNAESQKEYKQPLYTGSWSDVLFAPFKWKNLNTPWVYVPVVLVSGYLLYNYKTAQIAQQNYRASNSQEALYGFAEGIAVPLGSSFGEEVLFRGFVQREARRYTDSIPLSILWETLMFAAIHPPSFRPGAAAGGVYFGLMVNHFDGNLEPGIAAHFWVDFISGTLVYLLFRKVEGRGVPLSTQITIPF